MPLTVRTVMPSLEQLSLLKRPQTISRSDSQTDYTADTSHPSHHDVHVRLSLAMSRYPTQAALASEEVPEQRRRCTNSFSTLYAAPYPCSGPHEPPSASQLIRGTSSSSLACALGAQGIAGNSFLRGSQHSIVGAAPSSTASCGPLLGSYLHAIDIGGVSHAVSNSEHHITSRMANRNDACMLTLPD